MPTNHGGPIICGHALSYHSCHHNICFKIYIFNVHNFYIFLDQVCLFRSSINLVLGFGQFWYCELVGRSKVAQSGHGIVLRDEMSGLWFMAIS